MNIFEQYKEEGLSLGARKIINTVAGCVMASHLDDKEKRNCIEFVRELEEYFEEQEGVEVSKQEKLQWLMDNIDDIEIEEMHQDSFTGTPTLLIQIFDWDKVDASPFKLEDSCITFE